MQPIDFFVLYRQLIRDREDTKRQLFTACRIAGWIPGSMLGDGKKKIKPTDFIKFEWEGKSSPKRAKPYTRDEKESFLKTMRPDWLPLLDN